MSPEHDDTKGSGKSGVSTKEMDFSGMDEEVVQEKKRLFAPLFGGEEQAEAVENAIHTRFEDYVLVKHDGIFYMVQLKEGSPRLVSWEEVREMPQLQKWCSEFFD